MTEDRLNNEYFEWMYNLVCNDRYSNGVTYRKLLSLLHNIEFVYILPEDRNRAAEGTEFRYRFGYENGYPYDMIEQYLDVRSCSVLEMMVSLAFTIEEDIMDDYEYGNRTGQWFWSMIVNLGLNHMSDDNFNEDYVKEVIFKFLERDYEKNGKGGLFMIHDDRDMRTAEIWHQAMWYLNEVIDA